MDAAARAFEDCVLGPGVSGQHGPLKTTRLLMLVMQVVKRFLFWKHYVFYNQYLIGSCFFWGGTGFISLVL